MDLAAAYAAHRLPLLRLAVLLVDDAATAEDVVQDAFLGMHRNATQVANSTALFGYLRTAVLNNARSVLRRRQTARRYLATVPPIEHERPADFAALIDAEHAEVIQAVRQLPPKQREVIVLRYWAGMTEPEVANALGITRGAVSSQASRAMTKLAAAGGDPMNATPDPRLEARVSTALYALASAVDERTASAGRIPVAGDRPALPASVSRLRPWLVPALAAAAVLFLVVGAVATDRVLRSSGGGVPTAGRSSTLPVPPGPPVSPDSSTAMVSPSLAAVPTAAQIADVLQRTVEVALPTEHFAGPVAPVTISDGAGGGLTAVIAERTPHADSAGTLVFFWHNQQFLGWDADQEALRTLHVTSSGSGSFAVTYQQFGATDPLCCPSLPTVTVHYRWNGTGFRPDRPVPTTVYGTNNPYTHPVRVTLRP